MNLKATLGKGLGLWSLYAAGAAGYIGGAVYLLSLLGVYVTSLGALTLGLSALGAVLLILALLKVKV